MELDNHTAKQTYIQLLADILKKKQEVLNELLDLTSRQEVIITAEPFQEEEFNNLIPMKEEKIQALVKLDNGFEQVYEGVKEEIFANKDKYKEQITNLKEYITLITDLSVKLQTLEKRNKSRMEVLFSTRRKDIKKSRISSKTAANYYKTMTQQHEAQSYFYDKKK